MPHNNINDKNNICTSLMKYSWLYQCITMIMASAPISNIIHYLENDHNKSQPYNTFYCVLCHTRVGATALSSINLLWPSGAIQWHISGPTLALIMAYCLMASSHYVNQCWLTIITSAMAKVMFSLMFWYQSEGNFPRNTSVISHSN